MKRGVNFLIVILFAFSGLFIVDVGDVYGKKKDGDPAAEFAKMGDIGTENTAEYLIKLGNGVILAKPRCSSGLEIK